MLPFILRRLAQSILTILGVMLITFLLFRCVAGDIAGANLGEKATQRQKADWRHSHGYDLPMVFNVHRTLLIEDKTTGNKPLAVKDAAGSNVADALALTLADVELLTKEESKTRGAAPRSNKLMGRYVARLDRDTPIGKLTDNAPLLAPAKPAAQEEEALAADASPIGAPATTPASAPAAKAAMDFTLADGSALHVDATGVTTAGDLIDRINTAPGNGGRVTAGVSSRTVWQVFDSQFFHHLWTSVCFDARDLKDNRKLTSIIVERAPASLAVQIPALAIEWFLAMIVSCYVAYYRGSVADRLGVLLSVLGMCIPFLGFMILGQYIVFEIAPEYAYGIDHVANLYVPVAIMVVAGLGGQVRFYRTIILDETNRDYVRTAIAKGVPLPNVLFKHVLKNCMLPILTSLILTIPFLIMGSLLVESYFGIPGLGDLMITSIQNRNEPIMSGLVFLTSLVYTIGVLLTDLSYAVFDPRIRLR